MIEQETAEREEIAAPAIRQPAEITDAGKASRKYMLKKATQELWRGERHAAWPAAMRVILPAKGNRVVCDR